jgi:hypothetical protein
MPHLPHQDGLSMPNQEDGIEIEKFHKLGYAFVFAGVAPFHVNVNRTVVILYQ